GTALAWPLNWLLGWCFWLFNAVFTAATRVYTRLVGGLLGGWLPAPLVVLVAVAGYAGHQFLGGWLSGWFNDGVDGWLGTWDHEMRPWGWQVAGAVLAVLATVALYLVVAWLLRGGRPPGLPVAVGAAHEVSGGGRPLTACAVPQEG